jgi:hypothetical protein
MVGPNVRKKPMAWLLTVAATAGLACYPGDDYCDYIPGQCIETVVVSGSECGGDACYSPGEFCDIYGCGEIGGGGGGEGGASNPDPTCSQLAQDSCFPAYSSCIDAYQRAFQNCMNQVSTQGDPTEENTCHEGFQAGSANCDTEFFGCVAMFGCP